MALTPAIVQQFLGAEKVVLASERMAWRRRNDAVVLCRLGVASAGATVGELLLLVSRFDAAYEQPPPPGEQLQLG